MRARSSFLPFIWDLSATKDADREVCVSSELPGVDD